MSRQLDVAVEAPQGLAPLSQAIVEHREVELDYFAAGRGQTERRTVQPHELLLPPRAVVPLGLVPHPRATSGSSASTASPTSPSPTAPSSAEGRRPSRSNHGEAAATVTVRFSPQVAPYMAERFGPAGRNEKDGGLEVEVPGDSERWLTSWVLSFGGDAEVISPSSAREAVARRHKRH